MNGSIRQRYKGTWQLRYEGPEDATGKRSQVNETVQGTRKEADKVLRERLLAIETGNYVARSKETVGQFMTAKHVPRQFHGPRGDRPNTDKVCLARPD